VNAALWILIATVALAVGAVLSALVQSLRDLSRAALEEIAAIRKEPAGIRRVERILEDVEGHAAAIALPRILCNLIVVVGLVLWIGDLRGAATLSWVEGVIGVVASSILLWVFGNILPHSIAKHAGEAAVYAWAPLLRGVYVVARPFTGMARGIDRIVKKIVGRAEVSDDEALQEEILSVVDDAQSEGKFDEAERDMIEAVVKFRSRTVAQAMTPRTEVESMELCNDLSKVAATIRTIGHSRIPVYRENLDSVVGIFYVKDLMKWLAGDGGSRSGRTFDLEALCRPALFVPETKTLRELLQELLSKRVHIAMVADEYGGTAGLITMEDIVEEVFGEIQDEYEEPVEQQGEVRLDADRKEAEVDARAYVTDVNAQLKAIGVEVPEGEDYDTVGGWVLVALGRIPAAGETFRHGRTLVTVLEAEPTRVTTVRMRVEEAEPQGEGAGETAQGARA